MQAMLYGNDVWKLHDILHKTKSRMRIQKKIGLPFSLHRYRHKAGYVLGIFAMLALLFYVSGYIWMIRVSGNSFVTEEMLESYLGRKGQGIGSKKKDMDCEILEKEILADFPEVIWVSVSMKGSSLGKCCCVRRRALRLCRKSIAGKQEKTPPTGRFFLST